MRAVGEPFCRLKDGKKGRSRAKRGNGRSGAAPGRGAKKDRNINDPRRQMPSGEFYILFSSATAATAVAVVIAASAVAGESKNYKDGDNDPDKALIVVEKSAKAIVVHGEPPKVFYRGILSPRYYNMSSLRGM